MILRPTDQKQKMLPTSEISAIAEARLRSSSYQALHGISCKADQGVLVLEGRLGSFFHKQLAQEIATSVDRVVQVVNQIEVD